MPTRSSKSPTKPEIVVLALADLDGASRPVDTEDIAMRAYALSPGAFSWRKFPEQVNLDGVRVALTDAAKPKAGSLVEGSVRTGWTLTAAGMVWIKKRGRTVRRTLGAVGSQLQEAARAETRKLAVERSRIQSLNAWLSWRRGESPSTRSAAEIFRVDEYTEPRTRRLKIQRMLEMFEDDPALGAFVRTMSEIVSRSDSARGDTRG